MECQSLWTQKPDPIASDRLSAPQSVHRKSTEGGQKKKIPILIEAKIEERDQQGKNRRIFPRKLPASSSAVIGPDPDPHSCDLSALPVPHFSPIFHPRYIEAVSALFLPPPTFIYTVLLARSGSPNPLYPFHTFARYTLLHLIHHSSRPDLNT